jgi:hypothetical protein
MSYIKFPKIPRLSRSCIISEKIDGTNAQIYILNPDLLSNDELMLMPSEGLLIAESAGLYMFAGSRTRYITPDADNHGFARWVKEHAEELFTLGDGRHFGEWWGNGIQRGYGLKEKRFSLFNCGRWVDVHGTPAYTREETERPPETAPECCHVVPVLYRGLFTTDEVDRQLASLGSSGSLAAPGFFRPEGIVIFHEPAGYLFKKTFDDSAKG